jgi:tetratricopeptide (TPR) repeat protein
MEDKNVLELAKQKFALSYKAYEQHRLADAEELTLQAKKLWEEQLGKESLQVSTCLNNLGRLCEETERPEEGIAFHREALKIRQKLLGDHPETAFCMGNLGTALAMAGHLEEAVDVLGQTVACFERCKDTGGHDVEGYKRNLKICQDALLQEQN